MAVFMAVILASPQPTGEPGWAASTKVASGGQEAA